MTLPYRHALVIGKFYPPHAGHEYLIRTASHQATTVSVVVMAASAETLSLATRVSWLCEIFASFTNVVVVGVLDDVPVDYASPAIWDAHVDLMRAGVREADDYRRGAPVPVDVVFTSELYGDELAQRFSAAHVCLDQARVLYPVSGTKARENLAECWQELPAPVRAGLCHRLVIVGAESTGKTTLARALAARLAEQGACWAATRWVPEFGREHTANKLALARAAAAAAVRVEDLSWRSDEFAFIAGEQQRWENAGAATTSPVLVCDTDAFATAIWHERYLGVSDEATSHIAAAVPQRRSYIVTDWRDVPFESDGLRDGEAIRGWMHDMFISRLSQQRADWCVVCGSLASRIDACLQWLQTRVKF